MKKCTGNDCSGLMLPVRDALDVISGKWKIPILIAISKGNHRFREIERAIKGIAPKVLSKELKEMELNLLVTRTVYDTAPVSVEYQLTPYSETLDAVIEALHTWGKQHRKLILKKL